MAIRDITVYLQARLGAVLMSEFNTVDGFHNFARNFSNLGGAGRYFIQRAIAYWSQ